MKLYKRTIVLLLIITQLRSALSFEVPELPLYYDDNEEERLEATNKVQEVPLYEDTADVDRPIVFPTEQSEQLEQESHIKNNAHKMTIFPAIIFMGTCLATSSCTSSTIILVISFAFSSINSAAAIPVENDSIIFPDEGSGSGDLIDLSTSAEEEESQTTTTKTTTPAEAVKEYFIPGSILDCINDTKREKMNLDAYRSRQSYSKFDMNDVTVSSCSAMHSDGKCPQLIT
jgi:hypothetical protein